MRDSFRSFTDSQTLWRCERFRGLGLLGSMPEAKFKDGFQGFRFALEGVGVWGSFGVQGTPSVGLQPF